MTHALPILVALIIAGSLHNTVSEVFPAGLAPFVSLLVFSGIYYAAFRFFKHLRDL